MAFIRTTVEEGIISPFSFIHRGAVCLPKRPLAVHILLARYSQAYIPPPNIALHTDALTRVRELGRYAAH